MRLVKFLIGCGLSLIVVTACSGDKQQNNTVHKIAVEVEPLVRGDITIMKTYSGTLEGAKQSKIYASIPERVISLPHVEGSYVSAGEPIVILDKGGTLSRYNQARAVYMNAKDNFEKMQNLYNQKAISEMSYKSSKTAYEVAEADFNAARAAVELSVPISGIVTDITVNVGDQAPLGLPIATVANTEKMRLTVYVVLDVMEKLKVGQEAKVSTNSFNPISAEIIAVSRSADPETRLFRVEMEMDNKDGLLRPGMYAKAEVVVEQLFDVLTINRKAVFTEEGIPKAYLIEDNTAYLRTLEIGASDENVIQVISGLDEGQYAVVVGKSSLRDGAPVMLPSKKDTADVSG
jgi:RND family efflux transporter MFP subunit